MIINIDTEKRGIGETEPTCFTISALRCLSVLVFALCVLPLASPFAFRCAAEAAGPLRVHPTNPRYFTDASGQAIYLTGSHTWSQMTTAFDFKAYLDFLQGYNHNFIRLWSGDYGIGTSPPPYVRTGPGTALDGGLKANLEQLNQVYFDMLRSHVTAARDRGLYVAINLFPVGDVRVSRGDWETSFFHVSNNVQGVNGNPNGDGFGTEAYDLSIPTITAYQEAFVRKVVDTVNDLDNVLYEIGNEGDVSGIQWQYHFVNFIKNYEAVKPKQHPVGMSAVFDWVGGTGVPHNDALYFSPADWIAPGGPTYADNPPTGSGSKPIIADVDHISLVKPPWIWKAFLRGLHPILMDWHNHGEPVWYTTVEQEAMRKYMGYTLSYARKTNFAAMTPRSDLTSTTYALATPGSEYLVFLPTSGSTFTLKVVPGTYTYEWFNPSVGSIAQTGTITAKGDNLSFIPPFSGEAVLYLKVVPPGD